MRSDIVFLTAALSAAFFVRPAVAEQTAPKTIRQAALETPAPGSHVGEVKVAALEKKSPAKRASRLVARINLSSQRMEVLVNGQVRHTWKVSSGAKGYYTPTGSYKPYYLAKMHYSKKYDNAPMPNAVFFRGGFAIHGTGSIGRLGTPASHGCVRLAPSNAKTFFGLVRKYGKASTQIRISGVTPSYSRKSYASNKRSRSRKSYGWNRITNYGNNYVNYRVRNWRYERRGSMRVRRVSGGRILHTRA